MSTHWVVVADASRARILESNELLDEVRLVRALDHAPGRAHVGDLVSDKRGSAQSRPGGARTAFEPHSDPHRVESASFAKTVATELALGLRDRAYERIVLCAPAHFLGELREALPKEIERKVVGSASHDWTAEPTEALPAILRGALDTGKLTTEGAWS